MGQRLVVSFKKEGKVILNTYFHWSGYTDSALLITDNLLEILKEGIPSDISSLVDVFKQLQNYNPCILITGILSEKCINSVLSKEDVNYLLISKEEKDNLLNLLENNYILYAVKDKEGSYDIFEEGYDRSQGLISIFERDIEISQKYSEGDVVFDLDNKIISFNVLFVDELSNYENYYIDSDITVEDYFKGKQIDFGNLDINNIPFEEFYRFMDLLNFDGDALDKNRNIVFSKIQ